MRFIEGLGIAATAVAGISGVASQMPEALACTDSDGNNATEWIGGDITVPHCDEENMGSVGNTVHDTGKLIAIVSFVAAAGAGVTVTLQERRRGATAQTSGN